MLYRTLEVKDLISNKDSEFEIIDLMENNDSHLKLVYLKKHEKIDTHISDNDVCIYVVDGEIEIIFNHDNDCTCTVCGCGLPSNDDDDEDGDEDGKKYKIKKEQFFLFEKNVEHAIKALKDSSFLLIKI